MSRWLAIAEIAASVASGKTSAHTNVTEALKRIEAGADYKAIIATTKERALARAKHIDEAVKKGDKVGRLAGVPFIAKDNFLVFGANSTAASNMLKNFDAPYQATVIERLEAEGAICVAKANLDAFAHGSSTENSDFFTTKNPHDTTRVPGGSSGGSAAAVVLDMAPFALGTDTGGSIRQPASLSGCVGYKPTYGLVSRSGVVAMASSTDVIGPLTKTVEDTALVLDVMSGIDPMDSTTIEKDKAGYADLKETVKGKKIGLVKEHFAEGVADDVQKSLKRVIDKLKAAGAQIVEVSLPSLPLALAVYYIICPAEVSSNLSRYDGQKYGLSAKSAKTLDESYLKTRSQGFNTENKRRIMIGTYVLSSGYYDAYYKKAQTVRTMLIEESKRAFEKVDFLLGPTSPTTAFKIGENIDDPLKMYLSDVMTINADLTGEPAINLPIHEADGLPVGMQLVAPARNDRELLAMAQAVEAVVR